MKYWHMISSIAKRYLLFQAASKFSRMGIGRSNPFNFSTGSNLMQYLFCYSATTTHNISSDNVFTSHMFFFIYPRRDIVCTWSACMGTLMYVRYVYELPTKQIYKNSPSNNFTAVQNYAGIIFIFQITTESTKVALKEVIATTCLWHKNSRSFM